MLWDLSFQICGTLSERDSIEEPEHTCSNSAIDVRGIPMQTEQHLCAYLGRIRPWNPTTAQLSQWFAVDGFAVTRPTDVNRFVVQSLLDLARRFPARTQLKLPQHSYCKRISSLRLSMSKPKKLHFRHSIPQNE